MAAEEIGARPADRDLADPPTFAQLSAALADATTELLDDHAFRMQVITHLPKSEVKELVDMYAARRKYLRRQAYEVGLRIQPEGPMA